MAKIEVELFRFDSHTDYLPYYTKHTVSYSADTTIDALLEKINMTAPFGFDKECICRINGFYLHSSERVSDVVSRCGEAITIESASEFLAYKDLQIDKSDFISKLELLAPFITQDEKESCLKHTELHYYASNTLNYKRDYIGDHVLLMASEIIEKRPELEMEILRLLSDKDNGIWYHSSLQNRLFTYEPKEEAKIEQLLQKCLEQLKPAPRSKIGKKICNLFQKEKGTFSDAADTHSKAFSAEVPQDFSGFNIASYEGAVSGDIASLVKKSGAVYIDIPAKHEDLTPHSQHVDKNFSFKIAGDILLQAMDNNADFIVVKNEVTRDFFDKNQEKMQHLTGREIGLGVITQAQFVQLLEGEKNRARLGFNDHKVKISFV